MKLKILKDLNGAQVQGASFSEEPFVWGSKMIPPGHVFATLGRRKPVMIENAMLKYCGRRGTDLFFSVKQDNGHDSEADGRFIRFTRLNKDCMLLQSGPQSYYNIQN